MKTIIERGASWTLDETKLLLALWGQDLVQRQATKAKRTREVYEKMSERFNQNGFERTAEQVRTRVFNMIAEYRRILKAPDQQERAKKCVFFEALHRIYQAKHMDDVKSALDDYEPDISFSPASNTISSEKGDESISDSEATDCNETINNTAANAISSHAIGNNASSSSTTITLTTSNNNNDNNGDSNAANYNLDKESSTNSTSSSNLTTKRIKLESPKSASTTTTNSSAQSAAGVAISASSSTNNSNSSNATTSNSTSSSANAELNNSTSSKQRSSATPIFAATLGGSGGPSASNSTSSSSSSSTSSSSSASQRHQSLLLPHANASSASPGNSTPANKIPTSNNSNSSTPSYININSTKLPIIRTNQLIGHSNGNDSINLNGTATRLPTTAITSHQLYQAPVNTFDVTSSALLIDRMFAHLSRESENMREWIALEKERLALERLRRQQETEREARRERVLIDTLMRFQEQWLSFLSRIDPKITENAPEPPPELKIPKESSSTESTQSQSINSTSNSTKDSNSSNPNDTSK